MDNSTIPQSCWRIWNQSDSPCVISAVKPCHFRTQGCPKHSYKIYIHCPGTWLCICSALHIWLLYLFMRCTCLCISGAWLRKSKAQCSSSSKPKSLFEWMILNNFNHLFQVNKYQVDRDRLTEFNYFGINESVRIHLDPEKFLPKPSWMAGTETLLLNSLAPPAWLEMLNLLIFFFLPLKLKRQH